MLAAVEAVERAGLKVARVDLSSFAALRSIAEEHLSVEAVIDLGAHLTTIVIHTRGVPKLVRTLSRGGEELTQRLADKLNMSMENAELAKYEVGLNGRQRRGDRSPQGCRPPTGGRDPQFDQLLRRRHRRDAARANLVDRRRVGIARASPNFIATQIGVPTNVVTPMQHIRNRWASKEVRLEESERSASAVSVGLAMGAAA